MIDQLDNLRKILDQEIKLRRLESKFLKNRYSNFSETLNKLKGESRDQLLDYAREFQRERLTYILTVEAKLRMWKKFADEYSQQIPDDPKIRELLALYVGYFRIYQMSKKSMIKMSFYCRRCLGKTILMGLFET
jgi:hypothetical protein